MNRKQQTRATPTRPQRKRQTMIRPFDTIRLRSTGSLGAADLELSDGSVRFSRAAVVYAGGLSGFAGEHSQHCGPSPQSEKKKMHGAHFLSPSRKQGNSQTRRCMCSDLVGLWRMRQACLVCCVHSMRLSRVPIHFLFLH